MTEVGEEESPADPSSSPNESIGDQGDEQQEEIQQPTRKTTLQRSVQVRFFANRFMLLLRNLERSAC